MRRNTIALNADAAFLQSALPPAGDCLPNVISD
jgi:hypothetical protein